MELTNGLMAFYKFENNLIDLSSNNYTATATGSPSFVEGVIGYGISFKNGDRINTPFTLNSSPISVSFWAFLKEPTTRSDFIQSDNGGFDFGIYLQSDIIRIGNASTALNTNYSPPLNNWFHLAVTLSATETKLYINNSLVFSGAGGNSGIGANYTIGNHITNTALFIKGNMDEVGIWNRALTKEEVEYLFKLPFNFGITGTAGTAILKTNYPERIEEPYILIPEISNVFEKDKVGI
jgi:hypothetical protein